MTLAGAIVIAAAAALVNSTCIISTIGGAFSRKPQELRSGLSDGAQRLLDAAFADLDPQKLTDYHVHILGLGTGGTGNWVNPEMQSWASPVKRFKFSVYMSASGIEDQENADRQFVERLVALARGIDRHGRHLAMAFDYHYRPDGTINYEKSEFYVPNEYVFAVAEEFPDVFDPVMSVHPYRKDALEELEKFSNRGGRFVKWLPNAMGMDPADPRCDPYYDKMKDLGLILISHAGEEKAVEAGDDQRLGNPLKLRRPLDRRLKVIVAHCASLGDGFDYDNPDAGMVPNFDLFLRLMDEPKYEGLVFGEISAMIQWNRLGRPLETMLKRDDLHSRLINGSDYPLPAINALVSTGDLEDDGYITGEERDYVNEIYDFNPLLFDYVLKRTLKDPDTGKRFSP
ncbi:MAG: amidohydrolase family protein, partial [Myxococcota bacterium]